MPDYKLGKIYMIYSIENPEDRYYGSTTQPLSKRFFQHTKAFLSSALLFEKYGVDGCKIELIEDFPCETKEQLTAREGYYIRSNKCVNIRILGRTLKEYQEQNKEKISERAKRWRELIIECECGQKIRQVSYTKHKCSKMHFEKLKNKLI